MYVHEFHGELCCFLPAFLTALAASVSVTITLAEGDRETQDIRIAVMR